ncbi:MAG: hypothetical protein FWF75_07080, partial [Propionibacteriaceae bacterium]|nr:hypothetical protein [Propionibacteriaceae bacterium]
KVGDLKEQATAKLDEVKKTEAYAQMADKVGDLKDAAAAKLDEVRDQFDGPDQPARAEAEADAPQAPVAEPSAATPEQPGTPA